MIDREHSLPLAKQAKALSISRRRATTSPAPFRRPILRTNQVWVMDITYIPMARGSAYLAAIID